MLLFILFPPTRGDCLCYPPLLPAAVPPPPPPPPPPHPSEVSVPGHCSTWACRHRDFGLATQLLPKYYEQGWAWPCPHVCKAPVPPTAVHKPKLNHHKPTPGPPPAAVVRGEKAANGPAGAVVRDVVFVAAGGLGIKFNKNSAPPEVSSLSEGGAAAALRDPALVYPVLPLALHASCAVNMDCPLGWD